MIWENVGVQYSLPKYPNEAYSTLHMVSRPALECLVHSGISTQVYDACKFGNTTLSALWNRTSMVLSGY